MTALERFEVKYVVTPDGHWQWTAYIGADGHGYFSYNGNMQFASHVSWLLYKGEIPEGMQVNHKRGCNHTWCVNPEHLYLGTQFENILDKVATGGPQGGVKLDRDAVVCIKKMLRDKQPLWLIAWIYQVTKHTIQDIRAGRHWKGVTI